MLRKPSARFAQDDRHSFVVILSEAKDLYIWGGKTKYIFDPSFAYSYTNLNQKVSQIASGFFDMARRRSAGLLEASQGPTTQPWRKRHRNMVDF